MPIANRSLWTAADKLEQAFRKAAGVAAGSTAPLDQALADLAQAIQKHRDSLKSPEGKIVEVDSPRLPSPVVARRTRNLRQEMDDLLNRVRTLRAKVTSQTPDLTLLRPDADRIVKDLKSFGDDEAELILDAVNTDIGAGD